MIHAESESRRDTAIDYRPEPYDEGWESIDGEARAYAGPPARIDQDVDQPRFLALDKEVR